MNVDISPKRPPMSSCTAAAPAGSGSDGGGSSVPRRSRRRIMWDLRGMENGPAATGCPDARPRPARCWAVTPCLRAAVEVLEDVGEALLDDVALDLQRRRELA